MSRPGALITAAMVVLVIVPDHHRRHVLPADQAQHQELWQGSSRGGGIGDRQRQGVAAVCRHQRHHRRPAGGLLLRVLTQAKQDCSGLDDTASPQQLRPGWRPPLHPAPARAQEDEALDALRIISKSLTKAKLRGLNLSDNALGEKGVRACAEVLTAQVGAPEPGAPCCVVAAASRGAPAGCLTTTTMPPPPRPPPPSLHSPPADGAGGALAAERGMLHLCLQGHR